MTQLIPFAFEDHLVRVVQPNGEPWFVGKDVCDVLQIRDHHQALERLDEDERGGYSVPTPSGEQTVTCVSEPGVYRLVFTSRKPQAERFKRWLAHEVLPALRKTGSYAMPGAHEAGEIAPEDGPLAALNAKIATIREARLLYGPERARGLWEAMGLPPVPALPDGPVEDAKACLQHLLDTVIGENKHFPEDALTVRRAIIGALEDVDVFDAALKAQGIRVMPEQDGFIVGNQSTTLMFRFKNTHWKDHRWRAALRRLPGARRVGPTKFGSMMASRGTFIPADLIDGN